LIVEKPPFKVRVSLAEHFSTMTREGTHALLAVILGLTVTDVVLDRHSEGNTSIVGDGLRVVLAVLIGYLGPSLFGLGAAKLISLGSHPVIAGAA
jgi:Peptidase M50B-like